MPWSAKAQELLQTQYAAVGAAGSASLPRAVAALEQAAGPAGRRGARQSSTEVEAGSASREQDIEQFVAAYRHYCWPVESLDDLKLAPFHLLATEGQVHTDKNHVWHMETLADGLPGRPRAAAGDPLQGRRRDRPGEPGGRDRLVGRS